MARVTVPPRGKRYCEGRTIHVRTATDPPRPAKHEASHHIKPHGIVPDDVVELEHVGAGTIVLANYCRVSCHGVSLDHGALLIYLPSLEVIILQDTPTCSILSSLPSGSTVGAYIVNYAIMRLWW